MNKSISLCFILLLNGVLFADWIRIDDFQDYPTGTSMNGINNWAVKDKGPTQMTVLPDVYAEGNLSVKMQRKKKEGDHDIFYHLGAVDIQPGRSGTVFCRFMIESGIDEELGSTVGKIQPVHMTFALTDMKLLHAGNRKVAILTQGLYSIAGMDRSAKPALETKRNHWYNLWIYIDNDLEKYQDSEAYLQEVGSGQNPIKLPGNPIVSLKQTLGILKTFGLVKSKSHGNTEVWMDDFYVDNTGKNFTDPTKSKTALGWKEKLAKEAAQYTPLLKKADTLEQAQMQASQLLAAMSSEERFALVTGSGWMGIAGFARLGIPAINFADASGGVHINGSGTFCYFCGYE
jgi:hypothetical protein